MDKLLHHALRAATGLGALLAAPVAWAQAPATFTVGAGCDFATVQAAVDAAFAHDDGEGSDTIRIVRNQNYVAQSIAIGAQDVELIGGLDDCLDDTPSGFTTISGVGGNQSVFRISGGGVRVLRHLNVRDGASVSGGGIDYNGAGVLIVRDSVIQENAAQQGGGGIAVHGSGLLELQAGALVLRNSAQFGAGLLVEDSARLVMNEEGTTVRENQAVGAGGGLFLRGTANAFIGSPGAGTLATFQENRARLGGGAALNGGFSFLSLNATDPARPVRFARNVATERGGAIYLNSVSQFDTRTGGNDFVLERNQAPDGAAIYGDSDEATDGSELGMSRCRIVDNIASIGAVVTLEGKPAFDVSRCRFHRNSGTNVFLVDHSGGADADLFEDVLVAGNSVSDSVFRMRGDAFNTVEFRRVTIGANPMGGSHVFRFDRKPPLTVWQSVIAVDQPGQLILDYGGGPATATVTTSYNILSEKATIAQGDTTSAEAPPWFVDPVNGDFHLRAGARGVDFVPPIGAPIVAGDIDGETRDRDLVPQPNEHGARDAGVYERQSNGNLVLNGDFDIDLRIFDKADYPVFVNHDPSTDFAGDSGSGSVKIDIPAGTPGPGGTLRPILVTGLVQCIPVPGPGNYRLTGAAYSGALLGFTHDHPRIDWRYRRVSDPTCSGTVDAEGSVGFGTVSGWRGPLGGPVTISATQPTESATIEVRLVVERNANDPLNSTLYSQFDGVVLTSIDDAGNAAPVAGDDRIALFARGGTETRLVGGATSLAANDFDGDAEPLVVETTPSQPPSHGTVSLQPNGTFTYTHDGSNTSVDSFEYRVCDPNMACDVGAVRVEIGGVLFVDGFE